MRNTLKTTALVSVVLIATVGILYEGQKQAGEKLESINRETLLRSEVERLRYIYSLSVEFGVSPLIVELTDFHARESMKMKHLRHRLISNPEFYTFIMLSLIHVESRGDSLAVGDGGKAIGLTQIWLSTAQAYKEGLKKEDLLDIDINLAISFKHFEELLERFDGNVLLALLAWNRGENAVKRSLLVGKSPENGYLRKVVHAALVANSQLRDKTHK